MPYTLLRIQGKFSALGCTDDTLHDIIQRPNQALELTATRRVLMFSDD
jgi:hypothetical protein